MVQKSIISVGYRYLLKNYPQLKNIAFIPVRGGSKSIPLKNIKLLSEQPLVYWTAKAANDALCIDKVVIATDSQTIKKVVGYEGEIIFDTTKPDGTMRKLMDVSRINSLGWKAQTELEDGIKIVYNDFLNNDKIRK